MATLSGRQPAYPVKAPDGGKDIQTIAQNVSIWIALTLIEPEWHVGPRRVGPC